MMTKAEAKAAGLKHYDGGAVCMRGHSPSLRFVSDGSCVTCKVASASLWHQSNPGKASAKSAAYRARNPEKVSEWHTNWVRDNTERAREIDAAYRERNHTKRRNSGLIAEATYRSGNREKIRAKGSKRRAAKLGSPDFHTADDILALERKQSGKCAHLWCRVKLGKKYHIDHIKPLALGGSDGRRNLQLLCAPCNLKKGARHPIEFAQSRGMLL